LIGIAIAKIPDSKEACRIRSEEPHSWRRLK
jgi:hypothetical protein